MSIKVTKTYLSASAKSLFQGPIIINMQQSQSRDFLFLAHVKLVVKCRPLIKEEYRLITSSFIYLPKNTYHPIKTQKIMEHTIHIYIVSNNSQTGVKSQNLCTHLG